MIPDCIKIPTEDIELAIQTDPLVQSSVIKAFEVETTDLIAANQFSAFGRFQAEINAWRDAAWTHLMANLHEGKHAVFTGVLIMAKVKCDALPELPLTNSPDLTKALPSPDSETDPNYPG